MKSRILGENYENINYIKKETGATIALRGKGSGLPGDGDAEEPLHVLVQLVLSEFQQSTTAAKVTV